MSSEYPCKIKVLRYVAVAHFRLSAISLQRCLEIIELKWGSFPKSWIQFLNWLDPS